MVSVSEGPPGAQLEWVKEKKGEKGRGNGKRETEGEALESILRT